MAWGDKGAKVMGRALPLEFESRLAFFSAVSLGTVPHLSEPPLSQQNEDIYNFHGGLTAVNFEKDNVKRLSRCLAPSSCRIQSGAVVRAEQYHVPGTLRGVGHLKMIRRYLRSSQSIR